MSDRDERYFASPPVSIKCANCDDMIYQSMDRWYHLNTGGRLCENPYVGGSQPLSKPARAYTLDEVNQFAQEYLKESPLTDTLTPELILSSLIVWARKREREVGDE